MNDIAAKVAYVKADTQRRAHRCHWPGCPKEVVPAMWGCPPHWYALPRHLRVALWEAYAPGQERTQRPSLKYINAARAIRDWIRRKQERELGEAAMTTLLLQERDDALRTLDLDWARLQVPYEVQDAVLLLSLHQSRVEVTAIEPDVRRESMQWLKDRGYTRWKGQAWPPNEELPE